MEADNGKIIIDGKTSTKEGDITLKATNKEYVAGEDGQNIIINQSGVVDSGRDANLIAVNGDLHVTDNVKAQASLNAITQGEGDIYLDKNVNVNKDMLMQTDVGDITVGKQVDASQGSVTLKTGDGDVTIGEKVSAGRDVSITTGTGDVTVGEDVTAGKNVSVTTGSGDVTVGSNGKGSVTADKDVTVNVGKGDVDIVQSVKSNNGSVSVESGKGDIHIGNNGPTVDTVTAKENATLKTSDGKITVDGKTSTEQGDITLKAANKEYVAGEAGKNIIINHTGQVAAGRDANLITKNGDLHVTDRVTAKDTLNAKTEGKGDILLDDDVEVKKDISMQTDTGNINVGKKVNADNGSVSMTTGTGNVTVGEKVTAKQDVSMTTGTGNIAIGEKVSAGQDVSMETGTGHITVGDDLTAGHNAIMSTGDGNITVGNKTTETGNVKAKGDVIAETGKGNVNIEKTVTSEQGSVAVKTQEGNIHVGDNGPTVKTVTAKENVDLETGNGKIEVFGKTSTEKGDITLKAANPKYKAGADGQNIIIAHNGQVASGRDATLVAKNGDLHVTDAVKAQRDVNAITQQQGDVFLDDSLNVKWNVKLQADDGDIVVPDSLTAGNNAELKTQKGNITSGSVTAGNNITATNGNGVTKANNLTAGNRIAVTNGDGQIDIGATDSVSASFANHGENGNVRIGTVKVEARGNANGTGTDDLHLGGSNVAAGTVVNKVSSTPLTISTQGATKSQPMKDFNIGVRNADGSYSGGISSASGAVVQQLWTDKGLIYMNGDSNLHVSKLVVNDKLHAANQNISVGVFGRPPTHDGERVVYWNNSKNNDPAGAMSRWYSGSYTDPSWMYLDLFYNGNIGSKYGVLIDAHGYRNLYGNSISVVDTMRKRLNVEERGYGITYYDRNNLIQIDDELISDSSGTIAVE